MGGKKAKSTSTSTSVNGSAQAWAQPYATAGASNVQSVFDQNQPALQGLTNNLRNDLIPQMTAKVQGSQDVAGQASQHWASLLGGNPQSNPFLDQIIGNAGNDIRGQVGSAMSMNGRYGSGAHQGVLANEIGKMASGLRYQDYNTQIGRQDAAAGAAQAAGSQDLQQLLAGYGMAAELPYTGSNNLANSLGALFNGGTSNSYSKETAGRPGLLSYLANGASAAAQVYAGK